MQKSGELIHTYESLKFRFIYAVYPLYIATTFAP
jgi:hypothetical protein